MPTQVDLRHLSITSLLRPHTKALVIGLIAVIGEGLANLLEPWPLKVVLDNVLRNRSGDGWFNKLIYSAAGTDKFAILKFAAFAVLAIAILDAICSYAEKYLTTSVGQWVMHDLRQTLYSHIQRLSLAYHDEKQTGDLISRVTSDIDSIQSFITSGLLGALVNGLTLVGMVAVMFYINWQFTLIALSVAPVLFVVVYHYTRPHQESLARGAQEGRRDRLRDPGSALVHARGEGLRARRLRTAAPRGGEPGIVEIALKARSLKAKLAPIVDIIVAVGTGLVLWFGARMVLAGTLTAGSLVVFICIWARCTSRCRSFPR